MRSPKGAFAHIKPDFTGLYRSLAIDCAVPTVIIQVLIHRGVPLIEALAIAAIVPATSATAAMVRKRRLDIIATIVLFFLGVGVLTSLTKGDVHVALAKESIGTALFGIVFLASLLARRPLMFTFGREFSTGNDPVRQAEWDALWSQPYFRFVNRAITAVWGVTYLVEAALRVVLAYALAPNLVALLSPMLALVTTLGLIAWTVLYTRHARRRGDEIRARLLAAEPAV